MNVVQTEIEDEPEILITAKYVTMLRKLETSIGKIFVMSKEMIFIIFSIRFDDAERFDTIYNLCQIIIHANVNCTIGD